MLLFGCLENTETLIHPYFISELSQTASFIDEGSFVATQGRESAFRNSFRHDNKGYKEDRFTQEYFLTNLNKSIESIIDQLDNTDYICNFQGLKELFHRKGVNMRFEWIVWIKLKTQRARVMVGADIIARCIKRMLNEKTSKRLRSFKKNSRPGQLEAQTQRKRVEEIIQDKSEFYLEDYFKKILCQYINFLIKDSAEVIFSLLSFLFMN